jgi:endonuclease/exonuclease/phosphatase family metal-dependent hydrolase
MPVVRVASFNAHWGLRYRGGGDLDLLAVARALDADVLCLQEVWRRRDGRADHERVAGQLGYHLVEARVPRDHNKTAPKAVRREDGERSWWGIALLSRHPVVASREFELGRVFADEAHRVALQVDLDVDGRAFVATCTHLTWRMWGVPKQLWRLRQALPPPEQPGFVAGDMNMWGPVVSGMLPGWRRTVRGRTWPMPAPMHQLDHILVNDAVHDEDGMVGAFAGSDHLPVRAVLRF